jgi:hypothetical protein
LFQAPIRRTVYIATPHYGTPLAYFALHPGIGLTSALGLFRSLMGGATWARFLRQAEDERRLEEQLRWVAARLPSVFELLPDEYYLTDQQPLVVVQGSLRRSPVTGPADTYAMNPVSRFPDPEHRRRAMEAMAFKSQLGKRIPESSLLIYSDTDVTPDQVLYRLGGFGRPYDSGQHGDQSVAAISATAGAGEARLVRGTHEGLPNSRETHRLIASFLG